MLKFRIIRHPELDSTQKYARLHLEELQHGDVVVAGTQTAGIGQYGRSWHSPASGNIYLTMVLETEEPLPDIPKITLLAARAIVEVLKKNSIVGSVKPPNDVLVNGKKIAGLLGTFIPHAATSRQGKLLMGVGINGNMSPEELAVIDQPAVSIRALAGHPVDMENILNGFLETFRNLYET